MRKVPILLAGVVLAGCDPSMEEPAKSNDSTAAKPAPAANAAIANETNLADDLTPPASTAEPAAPATRPKDESYAALGQEPGWALKIADGRIDYTGNYGEKKIDVARPEPRPSINGRRYVTPRLTVDITYARCNDAMSGFGFEHQVTVIADGETYKGCGGARKIEWDM
jgi:uncharacterized membrane protein